MFVSTITEENLTLETVDRLLFQGLEDSGDPADCIIEHHRYYFQAEGNRFAFISFSAK